MTGSICFILHAHLPFIRHPEHDSFFEERWFFEAVMESYIPLLDMLHRLADERVEARLTFSVSPTLMTLFNDPLMQRRCEAYIEQQIELAEKETRRTQGRGIEEQLAAMYLRRFKRCRDFLRDFCRGNLTNAFCSLRDRGIVELGTTAATHGYLPLLAEDEASVRAQIMTGVQCFQRFAGFPPRFFWLPECGYYAGVEKFLAEAGIETTVLDAHGFRHADPPPPGDVFSPARCPNGLTVLARDPAAAQQVWSADEGYPGDPDYREYHRDIGHVLPEEYIAPYILDGRIRINTGIKYWRVTDRESDRKEWYNPLRAGEKARRHAEHFVRMRKRAFREHNECSDSAPVCVAPYDCELFGHWWYEGPRWLEHVLRLTAADPELETRAVGEMAARRPPPPSIRPADSSWGQNGYHEYWLNESNAWCRPELHEASERLRAAVGRPPPRRGSPEDRALKQAARELLLAQASDWPFLIRSDTAGRYAEERFRKHIHRVHWLCGFIERNEPVNLPGLAALEAADNIFPNIDCLYFRDGRE